MAYAFGGRLDDDSYAVTYIDEDQGTAVTVGEINGVPFSGGGGDFSTAEITINNSTDATVYLCAIDEEYGTWVKVAGNEGEAETVSVPLYKGNSFAFVTFGGDAATVSVSGGITYEDDSLYITGDGSITIS